MNDIKTKDISEIFEIFSKDIFGAKRYSQDELILIKQICAVVYKALLGKKNDEIELIDFPYNEKLLSKFFLVTPIFYCEKCEEEHLTTCNICGMNLIWENGLYCPTCKNSKTDKIYSKCDNNGDSVELKLEESIVLIPNNELNTIIFQFAGQMQEVFNTEKQRFYIKNSMLYYYNSVNNAEIKITELSHFNNLDLTLQTTNCNEYSTLKAECLHLPEKCKSASQKNCSNCLETKNRFCLMKMFKYIESTYNLQPHKGQEYGDVSFSTILNGEQRVLKLVMKKYEGVQKALPTKGVGREILVQVVTQYIRDAYNPILGILIPSGLDAYLKADILELVKYKQGQVVFIQESEFVGIYKNAKSLGFSCK